MRSALLQARERTLALAGAYESALGAHDMAIPYRETLNPPLWEWGHLAWFQEYWVARNRQRALGTRCDPDHAREPSLLPRSDSLYDSGRVAHRSRWELPLPNAVATRAFLADTLAQTLELLERLPEQAGDDALYFFRLVALHEEMHAEAACYMARALGIAVPSQVLQRTAPLEGGRILDIPAQAFQLGYAGSGFAFDNELQAHAVRLHAFRIDAQPVSWSRFLAFAGAGGYEQPQFWSDEGWAWLRAHGRPRHEEAGIHSNAAALHVSAHEAEAWCRWAGRRLPTEAEWECAALTAPGFSWGQAWEWTASAFNPYPGFEPHPYRDYSQPWFGTRRVLKGACAAASPSLVHPRYRNFFEPHRTDVFAGFRSCD